MQSPQKEKSLPDQVVLLMDRTNSNAGRPIPVPKPKSRFLPSQYIQPLKSDDPDAAAGDELISSDDEEDSDDLYEDDDQEKLNEENWRKKWKVGWRTIAEWAAFFVILACLVTSLTAQSWKRRHLWGLVIWKWILMAMVVFSGRLVSSWVVCLLAFPIERNFILRVYFVYGVRKSVRNCIWLGLALLAWYVMFNPEVKDMADTYGLWKLVWRVLITVTIGAVIWRVKIIVMKILASSFYVANFFDRMKVSMFYYLILEKLLGQPQDELTRSGDPSMRKKTMDRAKSMAARMSSRMGSGNPSEGKKTMDRAKSMAARMSSRMGNGSRRQIDMEKLRRLNQKNASAYTVKRLVNHVRYLGLPSISSTVEQTMEDFMKIESDMASAEFEARMCAKRIFENVAIEGEKYIGERDLLRFLEKDEVHGILPLFPEAHEGGKNRKIKKSAFRNWVVETYWERGCLAYALSDAKKSVQQLHKLVNAVVIVIIIIMSLLVMGVATMKFLLLVSSQLILVAFVFGNTCKTIFESIIFFFALHPFDAGDRCVIDGVQMIVDKMNFLMTEFIRYDNEKIYYPNSVLLSKPISNFNRSPAMGDSVEFAIEFDAANEDETFTNMKDEIKKYIESKPNYWHPRHHVVVKEIENVNKMNIVLYFTHTTNYQNHIEKLNRRSKLVFEFKRIFESLQMKYHLLPQQVHHVNGDRAPAVPMTTS